jgi:hypothetical protein
MSSHQFIEFAFARVAKRRVANIVDQGQSLAELTVEAESGGNSTRDLGDFEGVSEPIAKMIGISRSKNLSLGFQTAKCARVNDAVAIACVLGAVRMPRFRKAATARKVFAHGQRRK